MKRKAAVIGIFTILALLVVAWLIQNHISQLQHQIDDLKAQNNELQNQINASKVRITQFLAVESYGGMFMDYNFSAKIQNIGTADVDNVLFEVIALNTTGTEVKWYTEHLGMLRSGEDREIAGYISISSFLPSHFQLRAIVKWNGIIVDEQTIP